MADEKQLDESPLLRKEPCPKCGSRDNLARYASGRAHCFGNCDYNEFPDDGGTYTPSARRPKLYEPYEGEYRSIAKDYGIDLDTCRALGIKIVSYAAKGVDEEGESFSYPKKKCIAFDYHDPETGSLWGQKIRYKISEEEKTFGFPHAPGHPPLWLQHKWPIGGDTRNLVIFEGEGDAAAYYQLTNGKYPVCSIPTGANGSVSILKAAYEFLDRYDKIVLIYDGDRAGRERAQEAAAALPANKAYIGEVQGHKDARSALMAGEGKAVQNAFFNAVKWRPQGIFTVGDLIDEARKPVVMGMPWWNETLTKWTFGRRPGELYTFGAGNSIGKTDWTTQSIAFDALVLKIMTAVIYLEQPPVETLKRLAGKIAGKPFHIPMEEGGYTQAELDQALDDLNATPNLIFAGNFTSTEWEDVEAKIRYLVATYGVRSVYLDNLTALIDEDNERASVEGIIKNMALLCQELGINIFLLCHLKDPGNTGPSHEEGGRVRLNQFKGSRAMGAWPHYAFGLERNTQHEDPAMRNYSTFRVVKDRYTGRSNGNTMCLHFDAETGQLNECEFPVEDDDDNDTGGFQPYEGGGSLDI